MIEWYVSTFTHYAIVALAIGGAMVLTYFGLRKVGVRREAATGFAFTLPWVLGFLIWNLVPAITSFYLSLTDYDVLQAPKWVGLANYRFLFQGDQQVWPAVSNTLWFMAVAVPANALFAFGVARPEGACELAIFDGFY